MVIALALAVALTPAKVIDVTLSCPVLLQGAAYVAESRGSVTTPRAAGFFQFWPTSLSFDQPAVQPGVDIATHPGSIAWDRRHRCARSRTIPLVPRGLKQDVVVTTHFVGSVDVRCRVAPNIRFRARITVVHGEPVRAQLIVVASKPVLYAEWTPSRIAVWDRPGCSA